MGHTKKQWKYSLKEHLHINDKIGEYVVYTHDIECDGEVIFRVRSEELAIRIVVEHNACIGLSNELLEEKILSKAVIFYIWNRNNPNVIDAEELEKGIDRICVKAGPPTSCKPENIEQK